MESCRSWSFERQVDPVRGQCGLVLEELLPGFAKLNSMIRHKPCCSMLNQENGTRQAIDLVRPAGASYILNH